MQRCRKQDVHMSWSVKSSVLRTFFCWCAGLLRLFSHGLAQSAVSVYVASPQRSTSPDAEAAGTVRRWWLWRGYVATLYQLHRLRCGMLFGNRVLRCILRYYSVTYLNHLRKTMRNLGWPVSRSRFEPSFVLPSRIPLFFFSVPSFFPFVPLFITFRFPQLFFLFPLLYFLLVLHSFSVFSLFFINLCLFFFFVIYFIPAIYPVAAGDTTEICNLWAVLTRLYLPLSTSALHC